MKIQCYISLNRATKLYTCDKYLNYAIVFMYIGARSRYINRHSILNDFFDKINGLVSIQTNDRSLNIDAFNIINYKELNNYIL